MIAGCGHYYVGVCSLCAGRRAREDSGSPPAAPATAFLLDQLRQEATRIARLLTLELREHGLQIRAITPGIGLAQAYAAALAMRLGASAEEISAPEGEVRRG